MIEGKAALGVDEINEVDAVTKQMQEGQRELQRAKELLCAMSEAEKAGLFKFVNWKAATKYFGLVIAADAEPNDLYDHSQYPGISLETVKARLRANHFASPQKFWRACSERQWFNDLKQYRESYRAVQVGNVTYELPILIGHRQEGDQRIGGAGEGIAGRGKRGRRR